MKRYYSHYTFIYPDIYFKNHIVEIDENHHIINCVPFEKEIERTEFYSGWLLFIPNEIFLTSDIMHQLDTRALEETQNIHNTALLTEGVMYNIYTEDGILISKS